MNELLNEIFAQPLEREKKIKQDEKQNNFFKEKNINYLRERYLVADGSGQVVFPSQFETRNLRRRRIRKTVSCGPHDG